MLSEISQAIKKTLHIQKYVQSNKLSVCTDYVTKLSKTLVVYLNNIHMRTQQPTKESVAQISVPIFADLFKSQPEALLCE
jgi:hypothetical protein